MSEDEGKKMSDYIESEIEILKKIRHDYIMKLFEVIRDVDKIYLITEFCGLG